MVARAGAELRGVVARFSHSAILILMSHFVT
jgi:hypothetical protein